MGHAHSRFVQHNIEPGCSPAGNAADCGTRQLHPQSIAVPNLLDSQCPQQIAQLLSVEVLIPQAPEDLVNEDGQHAGQILVHLHAGRGQHNVGHMLQGQLLQGTGEQGKMAYSLNRRTVMAPNHTVRSRLVQQASLIVVMCCRDGPTWGKTSHKLH